MVGKTQANVNVLKVILLQYGVDPAKVEIVQFPASEAAEAIRKQTADVYLAAGPVNSKITTDAIAASAKDGGAADIPGHRCIGSDRDTIIRPMRRWKFRPVRSVHPPGRKRK